MKQEDPKFLSDIARNIYKSVVSGILNLLEHDIFYCDLKPSNLLYSYSDDINNLKNITDLKEILSKMSIYFGDIGGIFFPEQFFYKNGITPPENFNTDLKPSSIFNNDIENIKFILNFIHQIFAFRYFCLVDKLTHRQDLDSLLRGSEQGPENLKKTFKSIDQKAFESIYFPQLFLGDIIKSPVLQFGNKFQIQFADSATLNNYESNKAVIIKILQLLLRCQDD